MSVDIIVLFAYTAVVYALQLLISLVVTSSVLFIVVKNAYGGIM